jgi:DNA-directed RNA polymerase specialized sigma24 family protein
LSPHAELHALSDNTLLARLRPLPRGSTERDAICEILVSRYAGLVQSCARPVPGEPRTGRGPAVTHATDIEAVHTHLGELPEREQRILMLRFYGNLTQEQIGDRLGISQMHVSRLLDRALTYLRAQITEPA